MSASAFFVLLKIILVFGALAVIFVSDAPPPYTPHPPTPTVMLVLTQRQTYTEKK